MILGEFQGEEPLVVARVLCPSLGIRVPVSFRLDTGLPLSRLSTADVPLDPTTYFPLDDAESIAVEGGYARAVRRSALLTFADDSGSRWMEEAHLTVFDGAAGESRLGRDVLNRWLMVYDPPGDQLMCEPAARS